MDEEDLVRRWVEKAEEDLEMCAVALEHRPALVEAICFHAQQAAEKYLKALLVKWEIPFRKVHSLAYLLDLVADRLEGAEGLKEGLYDLAEELDGYAVEVRHPDSELQLSGDNARKAHQSALAVKANVLSLMAED